MIKLPWTNQAEGSNAVPAANFQIKPPKATSVAGKHAPPKPKGPGVATQAPDLIGEPVGIRTRDLLIKSQLLYQLSYRPTSRLATECQRARQPPFPEYSASTGPAVSFEPTKSGGTGKIAATGV